MSVNQLFSHLGTPIQNSLKDLYMLLSFLKLKPFDVKEWWSRIIQRPVTMGDRVGLQYVNNNTPYINKAEQVWFSKP